MASLGQLLLQEVPEVESARLARQQQIQAEQERRLREAAELEARKRRREEQVDLRFAEAIRLGAGDPDKTSQYVREMAPQRFPAWQKADDEHFTSLLNREKGQNELDQLQSAEFSADLDTIKGMDASLRPEAYKTALGKVPEHKRKLLPQDWPGDEGFALVMALQGMGRVRRDQAIQRQEQEIKKKTADTAARRLTIDEMAERRQLFEAQQPGKMPAEDAMFLGGYYSARGITEPTGQQTMDALEALRKHKQRDAEKTVQVLGPGGKPRFAREKEALEQGLEPYHASPSERERLVQVMGPGGTPIWVRESAAVGQPAAQTARAVTGLERQALAYYNRAKDASETITTTSGSTPSLEDRVAKSGLGTQVGLKLPNLLQSSDQQAYTQAQRAFTEARLRKESGAAIPTHEYTNDAKTYFAQPGDAAAVIDQKRKARQKVLDGLAFAAGKAYEEFYGEPRKSSGSKAAPEGQKAGAPEPIVQHSPSTGAYRYSLDGGKTWQPGQPPAQ